MEAQLPEEFDFFETEKEALAEYNELCPAYLRGRVWVADLMNDRTLADSWAR